MCEDVVVFILKTGLPAIQSYNESDTAIKPCRGYLGSTGILMLLI